jgi:hypothetical protein
LYIRNINAPTAAGRLAAVVREFIVQWAKQHGHQYPMTPDNRDLQDFMQPYVEREDLVSRLDEAINEGMRTNSVESLQRALQLADHIDLVNQRLAGYKR